MAIRPTINNNGTAADDLFNEYLDAHTAVRQAISALCKAAPNGRDYQTVDRREYSEARHTFEQLHSDLVNVRNELFEAAMHIQKQVLK